ncbi:MAG TPA: TonB-dependent receptor [Gammaproteobacteria bacterium]|nr:TonB-dependent receptor [Gammaproteobacteria bacterium]
MKLRPAWPATAASALLFAQPSAADPLQLDDVLVTATRREMSVAQALPPVIVIDRAQIERSGALDVAELLRYHAGLEIARNGGPGQVTSAFIRGANGNHTLVLIDGVKVNPGTAGGAALQNITPELVERIEIVKGPRSSLYGSEAIGGVINIITRRGGQGREFGARVQAGRYGTRGAGANLSWQGAGLGAGLAATTLRSDGFPTFRDSDEDSGFENDAVNAWLRATRGAFELEFSHWQAAGNVEYADFFRAPQDQDFTNRLSRAQLVWSGPRWRSTLSLSRFLDRIEQGELAFDPDDFVKTERDLLDWQNDLDLVTGLELTAGVALARERTAGQSFGSVLESSPGRGHADRDEEAVYLQAGFELGRHRLAAAGRHTDHEVFGGVDTWNLEWGTPLGARWALVAGLGRGFRAPSTSDLYAFGGNPELDPEISRSVDVGIRHRPNPAHELELALFHTEITDLIQYLDPDGFMGPLPGRNENVGDARIKGAELSWRARYGDWRVTTTLLTQRPEDRDTGEQLLRRAKRSATLNMSRQVGPHEFGLQALATGPRRDVGGVRLAGYVLAGFTASFALTERWTLGARLDNLLDQDYELVEGYNVAGRGVYASLAYGY